MQRHSVRKLTGSRRHTWWHHILMIVYLQSGNVVWIVLAFAVGLVGAIFFSMVDLFFVKIVVGLPLILAAGSIILFKVFEHILLITDSARTRALCKFCHQQ